MNDIQELTTATSLKELFQGMAPEAMRIVMGKVISASPLQIQLANDEKMIISSSIMRLPRHLSSYKTSVDISGGSVTAPTGGGQGSHSHSNGTHGGHTGGDGAHSHSGDGDHAHALASFAVTGATMTVHNSLKEGENVYILSFNHGKAYYILDREVLV